MVFLVAMAGKTYAQFPEGFEDATFPPAGWASFAGTNGLGTTESWQSTSDISHSGTNSAVIFWEDVDGGLAEDWLVTPQVAITAANANLSFWQTQAFTTDYGSVYTVRVSTTSQTNIASFTTVLTQTEADVPTSFDIKNVDLSAYIGQSVYVAFVMTNDDGDAWVLDDINFGTATPTPDCAINPSPADMATNVSADTVTLSWSPAATGAAVTSYDVYGGLAPDALGLIGNFTDTTTGPLITGLYNTTFYWKVVPKGDGGGNNTCAAWSFTTEASPGYCLTGDQYPADTYVADSCDGVEIHDITDVGYAGEYSMVTVSAGETYKFMSSVPTDFITISDDAGTTALAYGTTPLTWVSTVSGDIRFYTHLDDQCGTESVDRTRSFVCGTPSADFPDYVGLQYPATMEIAEGATGTVYGQVYEPGVTEAAGQGAGITAWVGVNTDDTDPATWPESAWTAATYNSACGGCGNNDEYMGEVGNGLSAGLYFYAVRFRLNAGAYAYGGTNGTNGNTWDGTTYINGQLTIDPAPAPANDECAGAIALTPGNNFAASAINTTNVGATGTETASCQTNSGENVWYSVVVPTSGTLTVATGPVDGSTFNDSVVTVFSGTCGSLTEIACADDNDADLFSTVEMTGLTPGATLYISVWRYNGTFASGTWGAFQVAAYDASLANSQFDADNFSAYPNPVKNILNIKGSDDIRSVVVYNMLGQQVLAKSVNASEGQLDMTALPTGTYMVKAASAKGMRTIKIVKE